MPCSLRRSAGVSDQTTASASSGRTKDTSSLAERVSSPGPGTQLQQPIEPGWRQTERTRDLRHRDRFAEYSEQPHEGGGILRQIPEAFVGEIVHRFGGLRQDPDGPWRSQIQSCRCPRCGFAQFGVLPQNAQLQAPQLLTGIDAQLAGQPIPQRAVGLQSVGLPTSPIVRQHQLRRPLLAQRFRPDEDDQIRRGLGVPAQVEQCLRPSLLGGEPSLVEPLRGAGQFVIIQAGERPIAPQRQCLLAPAQPVFGVPVGEVGGQRLEDHRVGVHQSRIESVTATGERHSRWSGDIARSRVRCTRNAVGALGGPPDGHSRSISSSERRTRPGRTANSESSAT